MTKKTLIAAGLSEEQADKIMEELESGYVPKADHDAVAEKLRLAEEKVETTEEALKKFDGVDVDDLKDQIERLGNDLKQKDTDYQQKIADMEFNTALDAAITAAKGKNTKAIRALLDIDTLKASKNQQEDMKAAIAQAAKENDYLFDKTSEKKFKGAKSAEKGDGGNGGAMTIENFRKLSPTERYDFSVKHPDEYKELYGGNT